LPAASAPDLDQDANAVEDLITVTADSPLIDERRIATGATVSASELRRIPGAQDPWAVLQSTPGVLTDRIDVSGNASGWMPSASVGASPVDQTGWSTGCGVYFTPEYFASEEYRKALEAFEEVEVTTGGAGGANR
jgi:hypothetical protein